MSTLAFGIFDDLRRPGMGTCSELDLSSPSVARRACARAGNAHAHGVDLYMYGGARGRRPGYMYGCTRAVAGESRQLLDIRNHSAVLSMHENQNF
jgi:hypothetical protein